MTMIGIRFDLRVPGFSASSLAEAYPACLDMCQWADEHAFDIAVLSEHHGVDDGFMSAPVTLAAAISSARCVESGRPSSCFANVCSSASPTASGSVIATAPLRSASVRRPSASSSASGFPCVSSSSL